MLLTVLFMALLITAYFLTHCGKQPTTSSKSADSQVAASVPPAVAPPSSAAIPDLPPPTATKESASAAPHPGQVRLSAGKPLPEIFPYQTERDTIQTLATTYDPKVIPKIAAYLTHADETVRAASLNALIQIGHSDAVPYLKDALAKAQGDEADRLRETIEFLSLPEAKIGK